MNRRIKREWIKCGFKGQDKAHLIDCSSKLIQLIIDHNTRKEDRKKSMINMDVTYNFKGNMVTELIKKQNNAP